MGDTCSPRCKCDYSANAIVLIKRIMQEIRATGKCGEFTVKWNGNAWELRKCAPPLVVRET